MLKAKDGSLEECLSIDCKKKQERFNFCKEHFGHFKAGLIKKNGVRASDYDKKLIHFEKHKRNYL